MIRLFFLLNLSFLLVACAGLRTDETRSAPLKKEVKDDSQMQASGGGKEETFRKRVVILPFLDATPDNPSEVRSVARSEFIQALNSAGIVIPVDSDEIKIDEKITARLGEYDLKAMAGQAANLGINALLEGKIINFRAHGMADPVGIIRQIKGRFEVQARIRLVAAGSGRDLMNTVKTVSVEKSDVRFGEKLDLASFLKSNPEILRQLVKEVFVEFVPAVGLALNKVQWEGRIAMVSGDRIFLNVGKISGLQVGEILKVSDEGEEIYDPQSGNFIGRVSGRLKGTLEVVSFFGKDGAIAVVHSGSGFRENDRVEPYSR